MWPDRPLSVHGCLLYVLQNTNISLPSLTFLYHFVSPWIHAPNSHSCSCILQEELVFPLRNQHLETGVDNTFTHSITSGTTACLWPVPLVEAHAGSEPAPGPWPWEGPGSHTHTSSLAGQSHLWLLAVDSMLCMTKDRVSLFQELRTWQTR